MRYCNFRFWTLTYFVTLALADIPCAQAALLDIPSTQPWSDTGIDIQAGQTLQITASGLVRYDTTSPAGVDANGVGPGWDGTDKKPGTVLPGSIHLSLIGKIGGSTSIATGLPVPEGISGKGDGFVGGTYSQVIPFSGRLFLGFNDDYFVDNNGSFSVTYSIVPEPACTSFLILAGACAWLRRTSKRGKTCS